MQPRDSNSAAVPAVSDSVSTVIVPPPLAAGDSAIPSA
jgi:hypothetical protein